MRHGATDTRQCRRTGVVGALACVLALAAGALLPLAAAPAMRAAVLDIDGAIGPAIADYVDRELARAAGDGTRLVVLRMNTPGGLDSSMRKIIGAILASPVPVATYVAPNGARAASAGTYIAYASAIAAMAPGTNIGAATPVQLGGAAFPTAAPDQPARKDGDQAARSAEPKDVETRKVVNDAVAYIRSLAELNGRNADWAADAVRTAVSIPASEALRLGVIDVIATDVPDLLRQIDGRTVRVADKPARLSTSGLEIVLARPGWRTEFLAVITDPNIAFMLMLVGVYGLIFEFLSPGATAPGVIGAISLLVALYALNLLPINYAGAALVLLGIGLMVAEVHIGAFGAIGVGGIVAFVVGAALMFPSGVPGYTLSPAVIAGAAIATALLFLVALALLLRARKRAVVTGGEALLGAAGEVVAWQGDEGRVRVHGEVWRAGARVPMQPGAHVKVIGRDGLVLMVGPP